MSFEPTTLNRKLGHRIGILVYGAMAGVLMGSVTGMALCWVVGLFDEIWHGLVLGGLTGPIVGILVAAVLSIRNSKQFRVRNDAATIVGIMCGLLPAVVVAMQYLGAVRGIVSGAYYVGVVFASPAIGLMIGGILDRSYDALSNRHWGVAIAFAIVGASSCLGLVYLVDAMAYGPDPSEVANVTRRAILIHWRERLDEEDVTINIQPLQRKGRRGYSGSYDATIGSHQERGIVEVVVEGEELSWQLEPASD